MTKTELILLALVNKDDLRLFSQVFTAVSFHVANANDHLELEKALQESSPTLVIISKNFDGEDGLEIASVLLDRYPTLPVMLLLQNDSPEIYKKAIRIGICDCLYPPLHVDEIMKAVENSIKRANRIGDWTRREVKLTTASLQLRVDELQKLDSIVEFIEDGVIIYDDQSKLLLINPAARRAFGLWQDADVKGKPVNDILPHPDLKILLTDSKKKQVLHNEITFEDGRVLSAKCTPIPSIGMAITMQDITYLKQIDHLKNEFVHTVSHDLRSPLTAILGYIELLDRVGPVNDQQREFITRVQNSVHNITALVNDLLELGRIEAGFDARKEIISLDGILHNSLDELGGQILEKKIKLRLNLPTAIPTMRGNPVRLRQMMDNLIGNAIKYTPEDGEITIDVEAHSDQIILRVSDTGPGIPPADQPHIFDKFFRASNVPKNVPGSGLGLAIVRSIVENHQGRVWVDSLLGMGSAFSVVFPIHNHKGIQSS